MKRDVVKAVIGALFIAVAAPGDGRGAATAALPVEAGSTSAAGLLATLRSGEGRRESRLVPVVTKTSDTGKPGDAHSVAVDDGGGFTVVGSSRNGTNDDYLVATCDRDGTILWRRTLDGGGRDVARGVAIGRHGNVYVTGYSQNGADYVCRTIRYDRSGDLVWDRTYDDGNADYCTGIAVDDSGNVLMVGTAGGKPLTVKYAPDGTLEWARVFEKEGSASGIAVDRSGFSYVVGVGGGMAGRLLLKYDPRGELLFARLHEPEREKGEDVAAAAAVAVDAAGDVFVTGSSREWRDSGYLLYTVTARYDPAGETVWVRRNPGSGGNGIALDERGDIYVAAGSLIKYDPAGNLLWKEPYGGSAVAVTRGAEEVVVAGSPFDASDFSVTKLHQR